jgi:hypothetical protein
MRLIVERKSLDFTFVSSLSRKTSSCVNFLLDCCACMDDRFCICLQCAMGGRGCLDLKHELLAGVKPT